MANSCRQLFSQKVLSYLFDRAQGTPLQYALMRQKALNKHDLNSLKLIF